MGSGPYNGLAVKTRSVADLAKIAAANTQVPIKHLQTGLAKSFPRSGPVGSRIRINCSSKLEENAFVGVKHHGQCFYISSTDQLSKRFSRIQQIFLSAEIAEAAGDVQLAPMLTVPVSR